MNEKRAGTAAWPWRSSLGRESAPTEEGSPGPGAATPESDRPPGAEAGTRELLPPAFFDREAEAVARELLGCRVVSTVGGERTSGVIVEAEAYVGPHDPASHARKEVGRTERNASMFGPPGRAYVYRSYGIHWLLNVVTGAEADPAAVLIRALDPGEGRDIMVERRNRTSDLCSGPGRLSQALGITGGLDGHDLSRPPLLLQRGWTVEPHRIGVSGRIGIRRAEDWPLRFYLRRHPSVSRSPST